VGSVAGILAKTHVSKRGGMTQTIIALCDSNLLGKVYSQGEAVLDLKNYRGFYEGNPVSEMEAIELLRKADNANIVGERAVAVAQKTLGVPKTRLKRISGIPHLQYYKI